MSNFLSDILGTSETRLRREIIALERRSQHPDHDLLLASTIYVSVRQKIKELGLDPDDTTAQELYFALNHKLAEADVKLIKKLRYIAAKDVNAEGNLVEGMVALAKSLGLDQAKVLGIKSSVVKSLLKANQPKKTMRALNYRSVESMLKLEPVALVMLAVNLYESASYSSSFYAKYKKLQATDCEEQAIKILAPTAKRWQPTLSSVEAKSGLMLVASPELATLILLPASNSPKAGYSSALLINLLAELELMQSLSSYLKVHLVNQDFGISLYEICHDEPDLGGHLFGHRVHWSNAQKLLTESVAELDMPHVSADELKPLDLMTKLGDVLEDFKFWQDSELLALAKAHGVTSLNVRDVAHNLVNDLSYDNRQLSHLRRSLVKKLTELYLSPSSITTVFGSQPEFNAQSSLETEQLQTADMV